MGDTVRLKSGGPLMTVTSFDAPVVAVTYFDDILNRRDETFDCQTLENSSKTLPDVERYHRWMPVATMASLNRQ